MTDYKLTFRRASLEDLSYIIELLLEDDLGAVREKAILGTEIDDRYIKAFNQICADPHQYLMVVLLQQQIVGTCHLTIMPSLAFTGSTRMQIEAVRISGLHRGQRIGEWMIRQAINYGKSQGATIVQLSTNKKRTDAKRFYERLGFVASHEGMKLNV